MQTTSVARLWRILFSGKRIISLELKDLLNENTIPDHLNHIRYGFTCTPLIYVILCGYTETASMLIDYGADVNLSDSTGMTAIMYAVWRCFGDCIKLLISRGADEDLENTLQRIAFVNLYREVNRENTKNLHSAVYAGQQMRNENLKQMQVRIIQESTLLPVLATIVAEYCYGKRCMLR